MVEPMSVEGCRASQRECATSVHQAIDDLRLEVKNDISLVREAVQEIDRNVSRIKGYLGINGAPVAAVPPLPAAPRLHRRDSETDEHHHRRAEDTPSGWLRKNWLLLVSLVLASFAGEKVIPALLKILGIQ